MSEQVAVCGPIIRIAPGCGGKRGVPASEAGLEPDDMANIFERSKQHWTWPLSNLPVSATLARSAVTGDMYTHTWSVISLAQ